MSLRYTHVFALPGENHIIDGAVDGRGIYSGETLDEIRIRYPSAELIDWDDWQQAASERQRTPITWEPTTAETYRDMLEVLPPALWTGGLFLVGEPTDHDIATGMPRFAAYWQRNGNHYFAASRPLTVEEARTEVNQIGMSR